MHRLIAGLVLLAVVMAGCGDSKSTPTAPATTPAPPNLELSGSYECTNRFCDNATYSIELTNTGGETANVNYVRGENRNEQPIWEFGANVFIETYGTNKIGPGEVFSGTFVRQLGFYIVVGYGDQRGQNWFVKWRLNPPR